MEQEKVNGTLGLLRLIGTIIVAAAILIGCGIMATTFAKRYYSSGGSSSFVPGGFVMNSVDSDYLMEELAQQYIGLRGPSINYEFQWKVWDNLLESGALDGTFVVYEYREIVADGAVDDIVLGEGQLRVGDRIEEIKQCRVFSKTRLDAWMLAQFERQAIAAPPEEGTS